MKRFLVKRPKDTVEVILLPNKDGSGFQYINLSKGHICPCKFKTEVEALADLEEESKNWIDDCEIVKFDIDISISNISEK